MKLILAGMGSFGQGWYQRVKADRPQFEVSVVDANPDAQRLLAPGDRFYLDFESALQAEQPDFLLNVTPPAVHSALNALAFRAGVPVLCEKPIAANYAEAAATVALAAELGVPFMIAENYRRWPFVRRLRRLIAAGAIGELATLHIFFGREAYYPKPYLLAMPYPLLTDVAVHHLDMLRYLSGQEGAQVAGRHYRPLGSPYPGKAASLLFIEMSAGLVACYDGSLSAKGRPTTWAGDWRIEGSEGVLELKNDEVYLTHGEETELQTDPEGEPTSHDALDEFLLCLAEGREPETSGRDYLKTQYLVDLAERA